MRGLRQSESCITTQRPNLKCRGWCFVGAQPQFCKASPSSHPLFSEYIDHSMSDPLSITASIVALLQLTQQAIQYVIDVKDAGGDRNRILTEITSAHGFLFLLQDKTKKSEPQWDNTFYKTMTALSAPNGPLEQFKHALERLASKLRPREGLKKFGKALSWPFEKREIKDILDTIERQKSLFSLALENDHMYVISSVLGADSSALSEMIKSDVQQVGHKLSELQLVQKCKDSFFSVYHPFVFSDLLC